jgi:hypothetical protein
MDQSGKRQLIEAKPDRAAAERFLPVRGRSCSSAAMPSLAQKFPTFDSFARAHLEEIYTPQRLESARRCSADTFESGMLVNDGKGGFAWRAFPRLAQASPGYGVVAADLDADGAPDVCAVQNSYSREPETGLWRGGVGVMLAGKAGGEFDLVWPAQSGVVVAGDGKGLALCDLENDGWPDLIATQNNDNLVVLRNRGLAGRSSLAVRLRGPKGNLQGIGARVRMSYAGGVAASSEIYGGSGYLSQSAPVVFFARTAAGGAQAESVTVRWPDGKETSVEVPASEACLSVSHPDR